MPSSTKKTQRVNFSTTLDPKRINKADLLKTLLRTEGVNKSGINELIEEGLDLVFDKYSKEISEDMQALLNSQ